MNTGTRLLFLIVFLLTSCISQQVAVEKQIPTPTDRAESTPAISVYDYVSSSNYKKECLEINPATVRAQAGYLGMYPGITRASDMKVALGEPIRIINGIRETTWYYHNKPKNLISVSITDNIVTRITDVNYDLTNPSLKEIVQEYGCPDIIQVVDRSEHSAGNYDAITLSYPQIGVEFWFEFNNKVHLTSAPSEIRYIKPMALREYIQWYSPFLSINSPMMKPVFWEEVIGDE
jgi:hypothetical protein